MLRRVMFALLVVPVAFAFVSGPRQRLLRPLPSVLSDGRLDVKALAVEARYEKKPFARVMGAAYFGTMFLGIASPLPSFLRLVLIQYAAFSFFEYAFHRWCMHAPSGTVRDKLFARWNRLHVQHHVDTRPDMTMVDGYNYKGIRFNYLTSRLSVVIGSLISIAVCSIFFRGGDFVLWQTPFAAALVAVYHGVLWNKLHVDSHSLEGDIRWDDGIPYVEKVPTSNRYARWLLTNHVGHHAVGGKGNYNIVFPGPDHLAGTFYRLAKN